MSLEKNVFDLRQKHFLVSEQQNLFPPHMFPARLNYETFASATKFPSLARPLEPQSIKEIVLIPCKFCSAGPQTANERKFHVCRFLLVFLLRDESSRSSYFKILIISNIE